MKTKNTDLLLHFNPREIIDAMPGLVCIFKPDGTLVFVNREYEKHFRMTAGHFIGKNLFRFIPKKDCAFVKKNIASLNQKNPTATYQHRVIGKSGNIYWQQWTDRVIYNKKKIIGYMSVGLDITGSKRAEEEKRLLIEKREKFSSLKSSISQLPMGNLEKKLARIVEFLADITNAGRVSIVLPELREKWLRIISAYGIWKKTLRKVNRPGNSHLMPVCYYVYQTGREIFINSEDEYQVLYVRQDDEVFKNNRRKTHRAFASTPFLVLPMKRKGHLYGILNISEKKHFTSEDVEVIREISEIISREIADEILYIMEQDKNAELTKNQQMLIQSAKLASLGELSAGIAHEINQPLTGISMGIGNILSRLKSGSLTDNYLGEKCTALLGYIDRTRRIIDHIRIFSREQSHQEIHVFSLQVCLQNALSLFEGQCRDSHIKIDTHISPQTFCISGNIYRLEQVLLNIFSNAHDAIIDKKKRNTHGRITVTAISENNRAVLTVEDNGIGIAEENLPRLGSPFFTTKETHRGTGLGLAISYKIIREMKGEINIASKAGKFTKVTISFPQKLIKNESKQA